MSDLAPLFLGALLVGVVWRMRMGLAAVLVAARARAGPRPISIARRGVRRHRPGVSVGLGLLVIADVGAILLLPVHSWSSRPVPSSPSCRPAWLPSDFPWIGAPLPFFFLVIFLPAFRFPVPAPGLLNAPSSHWVCTLRSGRRDRGSFEQGVRLSAALERNDSTTRLPKVASPSTATKIALWNPGAPWQDRRQGPMRRQWGSRRVVCVGARQDRWEGGTARPGCATPIARLRCCDEWWTGTAVEEDSCLLCKRSARNRARARARRLEDPVPARLARAEGVY